MIWYTTRETIKNACEIRNSVRANTQIDRIIAEHSRNVDRLCRRIFYPRFATHSFDWPDESRPTPWRIWLGGNAELLELTGLSSAGTTISTGSVKLYPTDGPPYTRLELDRSTIAGFTVATTPQQTVSITGLFGSAPDTAESVGTIAEDLDATETGIDIADSSLIGVGDLLRCGDERIIVTGKQTLTTALTITANLTAEMKSTTLTLSGTTAAPRPGEMILVDGERMLVQDITGTSCYVTRAVDGTVLAAHTAGATVFAYRTLTVTRGAVGSTAATHTTGAALTRWVPPDGPAGLVVAETLNQIAQEGSAYARVVGSGEGAREARGAGLKDKRTEIRTLWGRRVRMGAT